MSKSNLITNTGHRFISKGKTAFKIHIHTPEDTVLHRSVGFVRIGEEKGLKKAIKLRNELGQQMWGKFWRRLWKIPIWWQDYRTVLNRKSFINPIQL